MNPFYVAQIVANDFPKTSANECVFVLFSPSFSVGGVVSFLAIL